MINVNKILGICNENMDGLNGVDAMEHVYNQIGKWIQANAKTLAADTIPEQSVPILLSISIDNAIVTIEKCNKFYVMES